MGMHVIGIRPPDGKWLKMKAVWDACVAAGVSPPAAVEEFFCERTPDPRGVIVNIRGAVTQYHTDAHEGFEVQIEALPADVKIIRFYNSY